MSQTGSGPQGPVLTRSLRDRQHYNMLSRAKRSLYISFDVGSTSSDVVAMDADREIVFCDYRRTFGRPIETLIEQLRLLLKHNETRRPALVVATGSVGRQVHEIRTLDSQQTQIRFGKIQLTGNTQEAEYQQERSDDKHHHAEVQHQRGGEAFQHIISLELYADTADDCPGPVRQLSLVREENRVPRVVEQIVDREIE